ncbi:MAG TPA: peptide-methionine (S)-S-oxide reductase MsrA [Actinomycetes bacterium]
MLFGRTPTMVTRQDALPGRPDRPFRIAPDHVVLGTPLEGPVPPGHEEIFVAMGCFWGSERIFWEIPGVDVTAVGYQGGYTPNPTYDETCTGLTGHTEAVRVVYDPATVSLETLLKAFWENHDPTTPNRQGGDVGTQYRSAIYTTTDAQLAEAEESRARYQQALKEAGFGEISTEIRPVSEAGEFWYAEDYHQGYLHKHPYGYCNHGFCPVAYDATAHGQDAPTGVELPEA